MNPLGLQFHDYLARPLIPIVQEIGLRGIPFSVEERDKRIFALRERIFTLDAGLEDFGIREQNSPARLAWRLGQFGVPLTKRTESGEQFQVNLEVLGRKNWEWNTKRTLAGKTALYPFLPLLIEHAKVTKARENLETFEPCFDGRLRCQLQAAATKTWRYASRAFGRKSRIGYCPVCCVWGQHGANLQNIPRKDERIVIKLPGEKEPRPLNVKECFVAEKGWKIGERDYSALELRIEAYRTRCALAIRELEGGLDMHSANARRMFSLTEELAVPKPRRTLAKNFRYALRGGGSDIAIQIALAKGGEFIDQEDIAQWRDALFSVYPEIPAWIEEVRTDLEAQVGAGRRRIIRNAFGCPRVLLGNEPLKEALATEISGTGSHLMSFALLRMAEEAPADYESIIGQMHDAYLLYAREEEIEERMAGVKREMERPLWHWDQVVSYPTDGKIGDSWGVMKEAA